MAIVIQKTISALTNMPAAIGLALNAIAIALILDGVMNKVRDLLIRFIDLNLDYVLKLECVWLLDLLGGVEFQLRR